MLSTFKVIKDIKIGLDGNYISLEDCSQGYRTKPIGNQKEVLVIGKVNQKDNGKINGDDGKDDETTIKDDGKDDEITIKDGGSHDIKSFILVVLPFYLHHMVIEG